MGEGVCVWGERGWVVRTAPALSVEGYRCGWVGVYIVASAPRRPSPAQPSAQVAVPQPAGTRQQLRKAAADGFERRGLWGWEFRREGM